MDKQLKIKFKELKNFVKEREKQSFYNDETEISLIYLLMVLYPNAHKNFEQKLRDNYMAGYIDGKKEAKQEYSKNEN